MSLLLVSPNIDLSTRIDPRVPRIIDVTINRRTAPAITYAAGQRRAPGVNHRRSRLQIQVRRSRRHKVPPPANVAKISLALSVTLLHVYFVFRVSWLKRYRQEETRSAAPRMRGAAKETGLREAEWLLPLTVLLKL